MRRNRLQKRSFDIHQDSGTKPRTTLPTLDELGLRSLSPVPLGSVNSMRSPGATASPKPILRRKTTIRSVPSNDGSNSSPASKLSELSGSVQSEASSSMSTMGGARSERPSLTVRLRSDNSTEGPPRRSGYSGDVRLVEPSPGAESGGVLSDGGGAAAAEPQADGQWDSTIGKAGLGKTGRVINKLVSDNDALKRDIQIERLRAEESKQAAKLIEDKMERMIQDYESRLLEANVTKTLLARKERQVESLQATVEQEKNKAEAATSRERTWRSELDKIQKDSTVQVEEATTHAALMEGRYNAISSHWRDQGADVKRTVSKVKGEISNIVAERLADDAKIQTLRDLCDQQDSNIKELLREKEEISRKFEEYKQTQEDDLCGIRTNARETELEQQRLLDESREALHKLKWALNVKENVKGAQ